MTASSTRHLSAGPALRRVAERFALVAVWMLMVGGFGIAVPSGFLTESNLSSIFASSAPEAILALALIVPMTAGDFDLSVGAVLTLSACLIGVLNAELGVPVGWAVVTALIAGTLTGAFNAFFIVVLRIPSLIVTLGTGSLVLGVAQCITNSSTISGVSRVLVNATVGVRLYGIPLDCYYVLLMALIGYYVFEYTPSGRRLLFVGLGREVARLNGVAVHRVRMGALTFSGLLSAFAGTLYCGVLGSADSSSGETLLLPAFAAVYLGATSIVPGRFNPIGTVVAVYFLATGITGLTMLGVPLWVTNVFNGVALISAVAISQFAGGRPSNEFS